MKIFIGADHRGFYLKEKLKETLVGRKFEVVDMGNFEYDEDDDFPDFAIKVARRVAKGEGVGVLLCGLGGMAMVANKVKGIKAVEVYDEDGARHAKTDDHANVLAISADVVNLDKAWEIVYAWLAADEKTDEKYLRRIKKIEKIEEEYFK